MKGAGLFWLLSCILGIQGLSTSPRIICRNEREGDEWHPRLTYKLEELYKSQISNTTIALPYISSALRMAACVTPDPCLNGGVRVVEGGVYRCVCLGNHVGQYCQSCRSVLEEDFPSAVVPHPTANLAGITRLSFKIRGSHSFGSHLMIRFTSKGHVLAGFCVGSLKRVTMRVYVAGGSSRSDLVSATQFSGHVDLHCDRSEFDSFWIEQTDSHFQLGLGGKSTPFLKTQWNRKETWSSVGVSGPQGTEWILDHPCRR
ncbi:uncharacterized protein LOC121432226 [Lytechinus variegatus]|uniref:uncharacterized protein LOC121432226 n=1 Tax=Lytechinus variegatus TaxID=7654 RepID=UPI001BB1CD81|nr:uncharacterized protein LOC121432226 [Lytechinus variegatus]